jgi:hypothetical protein
LIVTETLGLADISASALKRLIEQLETLYPDQYPDYSLSEKDFAYRAGQVSVVRLLKYKLSEMNGE